MDSILESVKKQIGPSASYTVFEPDLIMHINSVFFVLNELGVGPEEPYSITGSEQTWSDFMLNVPEAVKTYMGIKTRLYFDPPTNSALLNALQEQVKELEWRLNVYVDPVKE